jgi:hypothetical protein
MHQLNDNNVHDVQFCYQKMGVRGCEVDFRARP